MTESKAGAAPRSPESVAGELLGKLHILAVTSDSDEKLYEAGKVIADAIRADRARLSERVEVLEGLIREVLREEDMLGSVTRAKLRAALEGQHQGRAEPEEGGT